MSRRVRIISLTAFTLLGIVLGIPFYKAPGEDGSVFLRPVVFIPGNGGNQLEARWTGREQGAREGCSPTSDWHRVWLDVWTLASESRVKCWADIFTLHFDPETEQSRNAAGVEMRVPGWRDPETTEYIDPSWSAWIAGNKGSYATPIFNVLAKLGYNRGETAMAAPYDFRFAPHSQESYYSRLKTLIEDSRKRTKKRVVLLTHSMGGLMAHYFLKHQPKAWKEEYVDSLVTLNSPWKGASLLVQTFISGFNWSAPVDPLWIREKQRHHESSAMLLPKKGAWNHDDILVKTSNRTYTVHDYEELFQDMGFSVGEIMRRIYDRPDYEFKHPGVPFHCMYGQGMPTVEGLVYGDDIKQTNMPKDFIIGDGDGTINDKSLRACDVFLGGATDQEKTYVYRYDHVTHNGIMVHPTTINDLANILTATFQRS